MSTLGCAAGGPISVAPRRPLPPLGVSTFRVARALRLRERSSGHRLPAAPNWQRNGRGSRLGRPLHAAQGRRRRAGRGRRDHFGTCSGSPSIRSPDAVCGRSRPMVSWRKYSRCRSARCQERRSWGSPPPTRSPTDGMWPRRQGRKPISTPTWPRKCWLAPGSSSHRASHITGLRTPDGAVFGPGQPAPATASKADELAAFLGRRV